MDNSNLMVEFYEDSMEMGYRSEQEGRPVFEQRLFIRIITPGDQTNLIETIATAEDKRQYAREYERYQRGQTAAQEGTSLTQWPGVNKSQIKEAAYFEIYTLEQLASLSDTNVGRMGMGWMELRNKAKAYMQAATDSAVVTRQQSEIEKLKADLLAMQNQISNLPVDKKRKEAAEA